MRRSLLHAVASLIAVLGSPAIAAATELHDPWYGEALFHAYQGHWFEALQRLDAEIAQHRGVDEPERDSLHAHIDHAEFSVGDFELNYRMHHRAGRAIRAVLEADVPDEVRNEAAYRLARIHFHKDQPEDALHVLDDIEGPMPVGLRDDVAFLRANVLMALDRAADAVEVLRGIEGSDDLAGFVDYNLGIALLRAERTAEAVRELDQAGRVSGRRDETRAIRDKANLVLGTMLFEAEEFDSAQRSLDRVRIEGPFSNQALLGAGWADASAENYARALVPWSILAERDTTDRAVQEAMLALPYAYGALEVHGRAAVLYERAANVFGEELAKIGASIESVRSGSFLAALTREEIRRDQDWVIRMRSLPDAPETFYLVELMASHDFQTALQNYLDLEDLRRKLAGWDRGLDAFEELTNLRRGYYEARLPEIDARFRKLDARMRLRLEQRERIARRLDRILVAPRPELLATASEQALEARLDGLAERVAGTEGAAEAGLARRIERLRGLLAWRQTTDYHRRLTETHEHLRALDADVEMLEDTYESYVRARQRAVHGYVGYQPRIDDLRARVAASRERVAELMERQGHMLETVATRELVARRERLEAYQNKARFAFADSYDRAVKAQARVE